jgi:hypothetical protein
MVVFLLEVMYMYNNGYNLLHPSLKTGPLGGEYPIEFTAETLQKLAVVRWNELRAENSETLSKAWKWCNSKGWNCVKVIIRPEPVGVFHQFITMIRIVDDFDDSKLIIGW